MRSTPGMIYFIGAGPGDPELLTVRGARLLAEADLIVYTGSLVPKRMLTHTKASALCVDSSSLTLTEIGELLCTHAQKGACCCRLHTGDPSLFGTLREETRLLEANGLAWETIPGVTAACAAAAKAGISFTIPETTQTLVISRMAGRTPVPDTEALRKLASHHTSLALYLSGTLAKELQAELLAAGLPLDCPILCAQKVGFPEEKLVWTTLATLPKTVEREHLDRQTVILVLPALKKNAPPSRLYADNFSHGFRK